GYRRGVASHRRREEQSTRTKSNGRPRRARYFANRSCRTVRYYRGVRHNRTGCCRIRWQADGALAAAPTLVRGTARITRIDWSRRPDQWGETLDSSDPRRAVNDYGHRLVGSGTEGLAGRIRGAGPSRVV